MVTVERAFVTMFPTKVKTKISSRKAGIVSSSIIIFFILFNGHLIYGSIIHETQLNTTENNFTSMKTVKTCFLRPGKYTDFFNDVWKKLLLIIGSVLPLISIVTGNAVIAISLIKSRRALRRVQHSDGIIVSQITRQSPSSFSNYKMFFILCSVYIGKTVPYGIYVNIFQFNKEVDEHTLAKYQLCAVLMRCLIWSNFSFNFVLYFMTGSLFRKEFKRISGTVYKSLSSIMIRNDNVQPQYDQNS
jgi:flagellar biosynthesis protein FliQ